MADAFISYSRKDAEFGHRLYTAMMGQARDVWMDWKDIPQSAEWWSEITSGIDLADNFVILISPNSIASPICNLEIDYARANNKRILPVVVQITNEREAFVDLVTRELNDFQKALIGKRDMLAVARDNWMKLEGLNWLLFSPTDDFDAKLRDLTNALDLDIDYVHEHTRLLNRAKDWERRGRLPSLLLRDDDLKQAESWSAASLNHTPEPTDQHNAYLLASRKAQDEQDRATAAQIRRTQQLRLASIAAGVIGALAIIAAFASFFIAQESTNSSATQVSNAQATLTPIPATLTPLAITLTAAEAQLQVAREDALALNGTAQHAEANVATAGADLVTAQGQATSAAELYNQSRLDALTQSANAASVRAQVIEAYATLSPIPGTLTPVRATLTAAAGLLAQAVGQVETQNAVASRAELAAATAEAELATSQAEATYAFLLYNEILNQAETQSALAATAQAEVAIAYATLTPIPATLTPVAATLTEAGVRIRAAQTAQYVAQARSVGAVIQATNVQTTLVVAEAALNAAIPTLTAAQSTLVAAESTLAASNAQIAVARTELGELRERVSSATERITDLLVTQFGAVLDQGRNTFEFVYAVESEFFRIDPNYQPRLGELALYNSALAVIGDACLDQPRNTICYAAGDMVAMGTSGMPTNFDRRGDIIDITAVESLTLAQAESLVDPNIAFAVLKIQANIPDTLPGQSVTIILIGPIGDRPMIPVGIRSPNGGTGIVRYDLPANLLIGFPDGSQVPLIFTADGYERGDN